GHGDGVAQILAEPPLVPRAGEILPVHGTAGLRVRRGLRREGGDEDGHDGRQSEGGEDHQDGVVRHPFRGGDPHRSRSPIRFTARLSRKISAVRTTATAAAEPTSPSSKARRYTS